MRKCTYTHIGTCVCVFIHVYIYAPTSLVGDKCYLREFESRQGGHVLYQDAHTDEGKLVVQRLRQDFSMYSMIMHTLYQNPPVEQFCGRTKKFASIRPLHLEPDS